MEVQVGKQNIFDGNDKSLRVSEESGSPKALGAHDIQLQLLLPSEEMAEED